MFISSKFIFNGIHCDDMCVNLVSFDSGVFNKYGFDYSEDITMIKNKRFSSYYLEEQPEADDITLCMVLSDSNNTPITWDKTTLDSVLGWLIQDDFCPFVSEDDMDLMYYLKVIKVSKYFTYDMKGYIEVTFRPYSNYAYRHANKTVVTDTETDFKLLNRSNVDNSYKPIMFIKNLGDTSNVITIKNLSNNIEFIIENLEADEVVTIDCLMGTVFNSNKENRLANCNRQWISLGKGNNLFKISGKSEVKFDCQFPIRM